MSTYNIYRNINQDEFVQLKLMLNKIEPVSSAIMQMNDFYPNRINYNDVLALDYIHKDQNFQGNIGVKYDDEISTQDRIAFKFYLLKSYDLSGFRYYTKESLEGIYTIEEVLKRYVELFNQCLHRYSVIKQKDLSETIELRT